MLGKSPIKWRQRPNMTVAVDWDVKHQYKLFCEETKEIGAPHLPRCEKVTQNTRTRVREILFESGKSQGIVREFCSTQIVDTLTGP